MTTILLTVDSLRYDFVFGDRRDYELPAIDRLAEEGTVFEKAYANASYTADSFTSILGGTHPWRYGTQAEGFEPERPHLVEPFAAADYHTVGVYANPFLDSSFEYDRGFDRYTDGHQSDTGAVGTARQFIVEHVPPESALYTALRWGHRTITSALGTELEGRSYPDAREVTDAFTASLQDTTEPLFAWLHFMDVHSPFYPHEDTRSEGIDESRAVSTFYSANKRPNDVSDAERDLLERLYVGELQYLDRELGRLLDHIEAELDDMTLVFTSDHGEAFGEHGFCFHPKELYQELVRIPLILRTPDGGSDTEGTPVSNVDVYPTLTEAAGLPETAAVEGRPLQEIVASDDESRYVFAQAIDEENTKAMVCDGQYKLIQDLDTDDSLLFDLDADPAERDALTDEPDVHDRLQGALREHLGEMEIDAAADRQRQDIPDEVTDRLERLGYK